MDCLSFLYLSFKINEIVTVQKKREREREEKWNFLKNKKKKDRGQVVEEFEVDGEEKFLDKSLKGPYSTLPSISVFKFVDLGTQDKGFHVQVNMKNPWWRSKPSILSLL